MALRDVEAMNRSLDADYGLDHADGVPGSHQLVLFTADPMLADAPADVEVTGPGYARVTIGPPDWADADGGAKTLLDAAQFPEATDAWGQITHYGLYDPVENTWWDCGPLGEVTNVVEPGPGPSVLPVVFYDDSLLNPDT